MTRSAALAGNLIAAGAVLLAVLAAPAGAQVSCGATIGPGEKVVLTGDVGPCTEATDPAILLTGRATLDLNGFRILCSGTPPVGVRMEGARARLRDGSIHGCLSAVRLEGEGGHDVRNVAALDNTSSGFAIQSNNNRLQGTISRGGFRGFALPRDWEGNRIKDSVAAGHAFQGFDINGHRNRVSKSYAVDNGTEGLYCDGTGNRFSGNRAYGNGEGIDIASSCLESSIKKNVSLGNTVDMVDEDCVNGNRWSKNVFGTNSGDCVK